MFQAALNRSRHGHSPVFCLGSFKSDMGCFNSRSIILLLSRLALHFIVFSPQGRKQGAIGIVF